MLRLLGGPEAVGATAGDAAYAAATAHQAGMSCGAVLGVLQALDRELQDRAAEKDVVALGIHLVALQAIPVVRAGMKHSGCLVSPHHFIRPCFIGPQPTACVSF